MGPLLQILAALAVQGAAELGYASGRELPGGLLLLLPLPHALAFFGRRLAIRGRFRAGALAMAASGATPVVGHAVCVLVLGWNRMLARFVEPPSLLAWPTPALFLALLPFLALSLLAIDARARIGGARGDTASSRRFGVRMLLGALLPFAIYVLVTWLFGLHPALRAHIELVSVWGAVFAGGMLVLFVLLLPFVFKNAWDTVPMPAGPTRAGLEALARHTRFRFRDLLVWRTGHLMANAAVVGVTPGSRLVLFSDALLAQLSPRELHAVFAHEIGHAKRAHVLVFIAWAATFFLGADWFAARYFAEDELLGVVVLLATFAVWYVAFGWLSRRCELDADLFSLGATGDAPAMIGALEKVGGAHSRRRTTWRHFSTARRVDFLVAVVEDPGIGRRLRRRLSFASALGALAFAAVGLAHGRDLVRDWPVDLAVVDLRLGDYDGAVERLSGLEAGQPELLRRAARAAELGAGGRTVAIDDLERAARRALERGEVVAAVDWLLLAGIRGREELEAVAWALSDGLANDPEEALEFVRDQAPEWLDDVEAWRERVRTGSR